MHYPLEVDNNKVIITMALKGGSNELVIIFPYYVR